MLEPFLEDRGDGGAKYPQGALPAPLTSTTRLPGLAFLFCLSTDNNCSFCGLIRVVVRVHAVLWWAVAQR